MTSNVDFVVKKLSAGGSERDNEVAGIKKLCSDRSYMGKDIGEIFSYRDLWADLVIDPYIELAADYIWIAADKEEGELIGYLTGAVTEDFYELQDKLITHHVDKLSTEGLLNLISNPVFAWGNAISVLSGLNRRTIDFLKYLKYQAREEIPERPPTPHFNVFARHDGSGIARALIRAYLSDLNRLQFERFHISALYVPGERMRRQLEEDGFRVRSLDFFLADYSIRDGVETTVFAPYEVMIGCFERDVAFSS